MPDGGWCNTAREVTVPYMGCMEQSFLTNLNKGNEEMKNFMFAVITLAFCSVANATIFGNTTNNTDNSTNYDQSQGQGQDQGQAQGQVATGGNSDANGTGIGVGTGGDATARGGNADSDSNATGIGTGIGGDSNARSGSYSDGGDSASISGATGGDSSVDTDVSNSAGAVSGSQSGSESSANGNSNGGSSDVSVQGGSTSYSSSSRALALSLPAATPGVGASAPCLVTTRGVTAVGVGASGNTKIDSECYNDLRIQKMFENCMVVAAAYAQLGNEGAVLDQLEACRVLAISSVGQ